MLVVVYMITLAEYFFNKLFMTFLVTGSHDFFVICTEQGTCIGAESFAFH